MTHNLVAVAMRKCETCESQFQPRAGGYNARYCSDTCKRRSQRARLRLNNPEQLKTARARSYHATKLHNDRYATRLESGKAQRKTVREWLADYKLTRGCVDCGYKAHSAALQLDHEGLKSVEIADARSSISRLKAEIEAGQCKVRCANCHSIRTWERKQQPPSDKGAVGKGCGE